MSGAWLDWRMKKNDEEIDGLMALSRKHDNITRADGRHETILRGDLSVEQLIAYTDYARVFDIPVSTANPSSGNATPVLARHVDFISVHPLPYWEHIPRKDAINFTGQYHRLKEPFPDKPVVIGEVGWLSNGDQDLRNRRSPTRQFLR